MNQVSVKTDNSLTDEQIKLIKSMYFKDSTNDEFNLFMHVCKKTGLDPALRQIHPVKRSTRQSDGSYKMTMTIQTGIDGYRLIAERSGRYAPGREATFVYDGHGKLISATAYVKKQTADGTWHEVSAMAFYDEYAQKDKSGSPTRFWKDMPHGQLAKCAEALALRKAFPGDLSGIYTKDEMQQANNPDLEEAQVECKSVVIKPDEAVELGKYLFECDPKYQKNFWPYLKEQIKVERLADLPVEHYQKIRNAIAKKRDEYNASQREVAHV